MQAVESMKRAITSQTLKDGLNWIATAPDLSIKDDHDFTALMYACKCSHKAAVDRLLAREVDYALQNIGGDTALHIACQEGSAEIVQRLLTGGATKIVNTPNDHGNTPLHFACFRRYADVCLLLIEAGAGPGVKNKYGKIPLDFAGENLREKLYQHANARGISLVSVPQAAARSFDDVEQEAKARRIAELRKQNWDIQSNALIYGDLLWKTESCDVYSGKCYGRRAIIKKYSVRGVPVSFEMIATLRKSLTVIQPLRHPNILMMSGACFEGSHLAVVYETETMQTMQQLLRDPDANLRTTDILTMAVDVCSALKYLHDNNVPHLSIKSQNIVMSTENGAQVLDYGLYNTALGQLCDNTATLFEPHWVAQEVLQTGKVEHPQAADVYSFGILLYELVTRQPPFADVNHMTVGLRVALEGLRPDIPDYVPAPLRRLMILCWHEQPELRPTFADVSAVLAKIMQKAVASTL